jgi:hypothetical protein
MVLLALVPWERGHPGRFLSRRDAGAPRENQARMSAQVLRYVHSEVGLAPDMRHGRTTYVAQEEDTP